MKFEVEKLGNQRAVVKVNGRLDANTAEEFKVGLAGVVAAGFNHLVIDMQAVSFIDSSGLSAIISGFKAVRGQDGAFALANVGPQTQVALEMTRLNRLFSIKTDVASALESF